MDEILFECLGIHFLEPTVSFSQKWKVKQAISAGNKSKSDAETKSFMQRLEKDLAERKEKERALKEALATPYNYKDLEKEGKGGTAFAKMSAADKRLDALEVKPKLSLALKMQVTK